MANASVLKEKKAVVTEIQDKIENASIAIVSQYSQMTVAEFTELRQAFRKEGADVKVYKNTFSRFALDNLNIDYPKEVLKGPSVMITTTGDVAKVSKIATGFAKDLEGFVIKGGVFEKALVGENVINSLAALPSREELIAKVVGGIKAPLTGLVASLSSPLRGLVYTVQAIKDQKDA